MDVKEQYSIMFTNYPDIINIEQMQNMLGGISLTLAYSLIKENKIKAMKIGRQYKITKANIKFCDFMINWLDIIKPRVVKTTYAGYERIVKGKVYNYFKKLDVSLKDLKPYHIQDFYTELYNLGLKGNTILRYHANIRKALQYAVKCELILTNPADKIDKPKKEQYIATYYNKAQLKANQEYNKKVFKKSYLNENGYVCVNTDGSILKPDYVSHKFNQILKNNNLKSIRFHDLRHSCASLLLLNKVSMKDIQIWLGHSSYNTTANIYTHVDTESKQNSALVI